MAEPLWHYTQNGVQQSPVAESELRRLAVDRRLSPGDMVWRDGMTQWSPAGQIPGLFPPGSVPPPIPNAAISYYGNYPNERPNDIGQDAGMRMLLPVGRSGWAIAAGYLGLFSLMLFPGPIALIVSIIAIIDMKKHPEKHGMGRAIFGLVMGIIGTAFVIFFLVAAIAHKLT